MTSIVHRLFFAVLPDAAALPAMAGVVDGLKSANAIRGRWTAPAKYHLTVQFLGDHRAPDALIEQAVAAAGGIEFAAFLLAFDRIATFRGRYQLPCVLRCTRECEEVVVALSARLGSALARLGIEREERRFIPHLTVAYADRMLQDMSIEPIEWRAREFVLVDSHVGRDRHEVIGRWAFAEPATAATGQSSAL